MGPNVPVLYALLKIRASAVPSGKCYASPARDCSRPFPGAKGRKEVEITVS